MCYPGSPGLRRRRQVLLGAPQLPAGLGARSEGVRHVPRRDTQLATDALADHSGEHDHQEAAHGRARHVEDLGEARLLDGRGRADVLDDEPLHEDAPAGSVAPALVDEAVRIGERCRGCIGVLGQSQIVCAW